MKKAILLPFLFLLLHVQAQEGTLDPTFGINGLYFFPPPISFYSIASNEGKVIYVTKTTNGFNINRYNSDASLDASFGNNGVVDSKFIDGDDVYAYLVQSDGKIIVGGTTVKRDVPPDQSYFAVARYNHDGTPDLSFGNNGLVLINRANADGGLDGFDQLVISNTDKLALMISRDVPGSKKTFVYLISTGGTAELTGPPAVSVNTAITGDRAAVSNNGKLIVEGYEHAMFADNTTEKNFLNLFQPDGQRDLSFGLNGVLEMDPRFRKLAFQIESKSIASTDFTLTRFNPDGSVDASFGTNGVVNSPFRINNFVIQNNEKIIIGGSSNGNFALARYTPDGTLDNTFGTNGITISNFKIDQNLGAQLQIGSNRLFVYSSGGVLAAYQLTSLLPLCTPPTFLNNNQIVLDASCKDGDGNISIIPTSGNAPFQYSINSGATYVQGPDGGYTFQNLAAGTYHLRLKDAGGCESAIVTKEIKRLYGGPAFLNNKTIVLDAGCAGNDGNISIIPTSGTAPYMYSIDGGANYVSGPGNGYTFQNLSAGTYQLRLKDANGCESAVIAKEVKTVYWSPTFLNNAQIVLDASCNGNDGAISIIPTCGVNPFQYSIDGRATYVAGPDRGYTFQGLAASTYQLRLKDGNGNQSAVVTRQVKPSAFGSCATLSAINQRLRSAAIEATSVRAYPNPSRGQFRIQLTGFASTRVQVSVLDARGSIVQTRTVNANEGNSFDVNLTGKAKGLYFVRVVSDKGIRVQKVQVQ